MLSDEEKAKIRAEEEYRASIRAPADEKVARERGAGGSWLQEDVDHSRRHLPPWVFAVVMVALLAVGLIAYLLILR